MADLIKPTEVPSGEPTEISTKNPAEIPAEVPAKTPATPTPEEIPAKDVNSLSTDGEQTQSKDLYEQAQATNKDLKQKLEDYKKANSNVFEENATLKVELEQQQKLVEMAKENTELTKQLTGIKKDSIVDSLIATGGLNVDLKEWAGELSLAQLEQFSKHAPKVKTILDEVNKGGSVNKTIEDLRNKQNESRIITHNQSV